MIERHHDAIRLNAVLNHPAVRPWVANDNAGVLDLTATAADPQHYVLLGEHGGCVFIRIEPGVYEVHTQVLPEGRGGWTRQVTEACVRYMFCRTDAYEIVTRVPGGHLAAKTAAEAQGMRLEFERAHGVVFRNHLVGVRIYSFRIQDWVARTAALETTGRWFHERLHDEAERIGAAAEPHEDDPNHNRYVGAAVEMAFGGQYLKAIGFYNRWVVLARHSRSGELQRVTLVRADPLVVKMDLGLLAFRDGDIRIVS